MNDRLKISKYLEKSNVNGPGVRFTIWFQGCRLNCDGCFNKNLRNFDDGIFISVEDIFSLIKETDALDGVTFSGGEPFCQAENLIKLSKKIKETGLSILSYTGYCLDDIINSGDNSQIELLNWIDILIDGPYKKEMPSRINFIGSCNQKIHILNKNMVDTLNEKDILNNTEITINEKGIITLTGFPDNDLKNMML